MCEQARPSASVSFSVCFANPRSTAPRTAARLAWSVVTSFRCGRYHPTTRQADHATRDRARETRRKRAGTMICKLACNISVSDSFSYSLPKQANPRLPFGVSSRGGFGLQSRPLERLPINGTARRTSRGKSRSSASVLCACRSPPHCRRGRRESCLHSEWWTDDAQRQSTSCPASGGA